MDEPSKPRRERKSRKPIKFTDLSFRNIKPEAEGFEVRDAGQRHLYLRVRPNGSKTWLFRYRFGKPKVLALQSGIGVAHARKLASDAAFLLSQRKDPAAERKAEIERTTLANEHTVMAVAENYMRQEGKALRSADSRHSILKRSIYPVIGDKQITDVTRDDITRMLDKVSETSGVVAADMCLSIVRKIFNWHETRTSRFRSPIVRGMRRSKPIERIRTRVLSDEEIREVWKAAGDKRLGVYGAALKFALLSGARRNEISGLRRSEIKVVRDNGSEFTCWELPAGRSKNKKPVTRPLSKAAQAIIEEMPVIGTDDDAEAFVFTLNGLRPITLKNDKKKALLEQISGTSGWTVHDLRRTFRTLLSRLRVPYEIKERALGHAPPMLDQVYDQDLHLGAMLEAVNKVAAEIERIITGESGKVIRLSR